jgi:hypothetical protein
MSARYLRSINKNVRHYAAQGYGAGTPGEWRPQGKTELTMADRS